MSSKLGQGFSRKGVMYYALSTDLVVKEGFNPRFDMGDLEMLAASIKENGVKIPLRVRRNDDGKLEVVDGHRRLAATSLIRQGGIEVPVVLIQVASELDALAETLVSNDGKPLLPMEEAAALKRLKDGGLSVKDIMKKIGRSDTFIFDRLRLLEATPEVQAAVAEGKIPVTMAAEIAKQKKEKQADMAKKAETKEGRRAVKKSMEKPKTAIQDQASSMVKAAGVAAEICKFLDTCNVNENVRQGARYALISQIQANMMEGDPQVMLGIVLGVELAVGAIVVPEVVQTSSEAVKPATTIAQQPIVSRTTLVRKMLKPRPVVEKQPNDITEVAPIAEAIKETAKKQRAPKKMTAPQAAAQAEANSAAIESTNLESGTSKNVAWPLGNGKDQYLDGIMKKTAAEVEQLNKPATE